MMTVQHMRHLVLNILDVKQKVAENLKWKPRTHLLYSMRDCEAHYLSLEELQKGLQPPSELVCWHVYWQEVVQALTV